MTNLKAPILILAAILIQSAFGQSSAIQPAKAGWQSIIAGARGAKNSPGL